jgi:MFS family permease
VAANGWLESAVVLSVLLGVVLGGALVAPGWLGSDFVVTMSGAVSAVFTAAGHVDALKALQVSLVGVVALYAVSALCHFGIRASGAKYPKRSFTPKALLTDFRAANRKLWRDRSGGLSLAVTTVFWGLSASLQFAVLLWAAQALHLGLDKAAYLQGMVALGVVGGAVWVAAKMKLRWATRILPLGLLMGGLLIVMPWLVTDWRWALPVLAVVGMLGGMMVVPMNALLQHRGHRLLTAGQSIAVQGFNENLGILLVLGLYAMLVAAHLPANAIMSLGGLGLALFLGRLLWRRKFANKCQASSTSTG